MRVTRKSRGKSTECRYEWDVISKRSLHPPHPVYNHTHTLQAFLTVAENVVVVNYPASAKAYLKMLPGLETMTTYCRNPEISTVFDEQKLLKLRALRTVQQDLCASIGIAEALPEYYP